jgi:hypothetical protein
MLGDDYINIHNEYLHSIGNLTLIRHNQELGNNSFDKKKDIYVNNSALIISQKEPTEFGLPIEIYFFLTDKVWDEFERIQSDIFDHLLVMVKVFDLELYQLDNRLPTG